MGRFLVLRPSVFRLQAAPCGATPRLRLVFLLLLVFGFAFSSIFASSSFLCFSFVRCSFFELRFCLFDLAPLFASDRALGLCFLFDLCFFFDPCFFFEFCITLRLMLLFLRLAPPPSGGALRIPTPPLFLGGGRAS
ncbi:hypothetical protein DFJ73DRAFT_808239 [Zopfochytrium polystomum]|nr:hypothetical protein DFJ73DRAFT_880916 [Zopfochytrium polystomum]KAI9365564.1 hypothetical protein DFJ73DRAFT_808239 [Zopfochytrium polystomum]